MHNTSPSGPPTLMSPGTARLSLARLDHVPEAASGDPTGQEPVPDAFREQIAEILDGFVARQRTALGPLGPDLDPLLDGAQVAVGGGKRLRAAFVYWGWRAAGGSASKTGSILSTTT
jgi:hypothetical protein